MFTVKQTETFAQWLKSLKDPSTRQRLIKRIRKASAGNLGDIESVGEGVFEMREHFGPGWRMYYALHGDILVIMLGGGNKSTQAKDITLAKDIAKRLRS